MTIPFASIQLYDDGSTDNTVAVANELGLDIITGNANAGVAYARNRLAEGVSTDWLHFHDADDRIAADFVERLQPLLPGADVVSCDADWISESDGTLEIAWRYDQAALRHDPYAHLLCNPMGLNSSIIRRTSWQAVGGCNEELKMWEDADVHIRLARNGARFAHLPAVLTWSLRRKESFSHDYRRSWAYRLDALSSYASHSSADRVRSVLATEAEHAARNLLSLGELAGSQRALDLCVRLGGRPPSSRSRLLNFLKPFVAPMTLLKLQQRHRNASDG